MNHISITVEYVGKKSALMSQCVRHVIKNSRTVEKPITKQQMELSKVMWCWIASRTLLANCQEKPLLLIVGFLISDRGIVEHTNRGVTRKTSFC